MQTPIDVPGLPGASTQFSPEKTPGLLMSLTDLGLEIEGKRVKAFIPIANIKVAVFFESKAESNNKR